MSFCTSKLNFLAILIVSALLNALTAQAHHAPVKTDGKGFAGYKQEFRINGLALNAGFGYQRPALWNHKSPPYNITVGEKIKSPSHDSGDRVADKKQQNTTAKNASGRPQKATGSVPEKTKSGDKRQQIELGSAKKSKKRQQKSIVSIDNKKMLELNFGWPIKGRVLKSFSPSHNKGIDIAGKKGQPVKAAEAGTAVYAGQGLIGFGKLLIIKHNDVYLSAYANNSRLLVDEGQRVQKGQVIAEVGNAGIKRTSLHFEIRKNGKPVNPLKLLPKK